MTYSTQPDPAGPAPADGPVLVVGFDPRPPGRAALAFAADLATRLCARHLHVVHTADARDFPIDPDSADWEEQTAAALETVRTYVSEALAPLTVAWTCHLGRGDPVRMIADLAEAEDAYLVVVGTRGEGVGAALSRLASTSVSHGLVHRGHRPVVIVAAPHEHR